MSGWSQCCETELPGRLGHSVRVAVGRAEKERNPHGAGPPLNEYGWTLCCQVRNNKDPVAVLLDVYIEANRLFWICRLMFFSKMSASKGWQLTMRSLPVRLEMLLPS